MSAKWQRVTLEISKEYGPTERQAIAFDVIDYIRKRTLRDNVDKNNSAFPKYSKEYMKSLDFRIAGKSKGTVNLKLSGDMLADLELLTHKSGEIRIGYQNGTENNAKADGNIRGTYGSSRPNSSKSRDFLGITSNDLEKILAKYPVGELKEATQRVGARDLVRAAFGTNEEDDS